MGRYQDGGAKVEAVEIEGRHVQGHGGGKKGGQGGREWGGGGSERSREMQVLSRPSTQFFFHTLAQVQALS